MSLVDTIKSGAQALLSQLLSRWQQSNRLFVLHTSLGDDALILESFKGIETVFGAPLPQGAEALLPDANHLPPGSLVETQANLPQPMLGELHSQKGASLGRADIGTRTPDESLLCGFRFELTVLSTIAGLDIQNLLGTAVLIEMQTAASRHELRPFHGHITQADAIESNGGLARYRLVVEPWLAFSRLQRDAWVFQDKTTLEILEDVFASYKDQGALVPAFKFALSDESVYPRRSLVTQYRETDWHFIARLLQSEGLFAWFDHEADTSSQSLGKHTLVISDRMSMDKAGKDNPESPLRFHRASSTEPAGDSFQDWNEVAQLSPNQVTLSSFDYRTLSPQVVTASTPGAVSMPGMQVVDQVSQYAWVSTEDGERRAQNLLAGWGITGRHVNAKSTVRSLGPFQTFVLSQHFRHPVASRFRALSILHEGRNNLTAEMSQVIDEAFDAPAQNANTKEEIEFYSNRAVCIFAGAAVGQGKPIIQEFAPLIPRFFDKPTASGTQTAVVVGQDGMPLETDRNHRVKVQFHWQRGDRSHSRLSSPIGECNAPASSNAFTWVRVASPSAGANFGGSIVPRIGQEVVVSFMNGDIDRPTIVGSVYNGKGQTDAAHNQRSAAVGLATANAPAWFAGDAGEHGHAAVLSGIKTQAMSNSQDGAGSYASGGYNQIIFDDTPNRGRLELSTTQAASQLQLGNVRHQSDNAHREGRGFGFALETTAFGAARAGQGLLISSVLQSLNSGGIVTAGIAQAVVNQASQNVSPWIDMASQHKATLPEEAKPGKMPFEVSLQKLADSLAETDTASDSGSGGAGTTPAWGNPHLTLESPAGHAWLTPASMLLSSTGPTFWSAQDLAFAAQASLAIAVPNGARLFAYGQKPLAGQPETTQGIRLAAASGKAILQAQKDKANINAQKGVTISSNASVTIASPTTLKLVAAGTRVEMKGGNITITTPGAAVFKAAAHSQTGPASATHTHPEFNTSKIGPHAKKFVFADLEGKGVEGAHVELFDPLTKKKFWSGATDTQGATPLSEREGSQAFTALVGFKDWTSSFEDLDKTRKAESISPYKYFSEEGDRENDC